VAWRAATRGLLASFGPLGRGAGLGGGGFCWYAAHRACALAVICAAVREKAPSTSLRWLTVLDVLFQLCLPALSGARIVSAAFAHTSRRNLLRNPAQRQQARSPL